MKQKPIIIGVGEVLWDMLPSGKKAGGAPVNFVYHASRMGAESYAISAVGNDPLGDEMLEE
ncbi:MAG: carbohydrate kinase, partial [Bacteroidales bacterium]|nr:carbohydrate kinase [Bacteroidales bacterium]